MPTLPHADTALRSTTPAKRAAAILVIALGCGLWTGLAHAAVLATTRHVLHELVWYSRDFVWMAPLTYTLLLLPAGIALAVLAYFVAHPAVRWLAIVASVTFGAFGLLLPYTAISRLASLILALGVGVSIARATSTSSPVWLARWRRLAVTGSGIVVVMAVCLPIARRLQERRAIAALATAESSAPNVLLLILDTVRATSMSLYGAAEQTTPRLQEWARQGVTFDWAFATAPWTLPSHASMFTGRYAGGTSADWKKPLDGRDSTLAELFAARGYVTGGFVGNMHYTSYDSGLGRGFIHYEDYPTSFAQLWNSSSYTQTILCATLVHAKSLGEVWAALRHPNFYIDMKHRFAPRRGGEVANDFLQWQQARQGRPFFAFLNFMDAHQPYYAPAAYHVSNRGYRHPGYDAAIAYLDDQVDAILRTLAKRNVLDKTVVIVASDHGELFNEHGLSGHAHNVYANVLHVPLVIRYPARVPAGTRIEHAVSLRDIAATVIDLAGVKGAIVSGTPLAARLRSDTASASAVLAEVTFAPNVSKDYPTAHGPLQALFDDSLHYIRNRMGKEELYAYRSDSLEATNLSTMDAAHTALLEQRMRLSGLLTARRTRLLADRRR